MQGIDTINVEINAWCDRHYFAIKMTHLMQSTDFGFGVWFTRKTFVCFRSSILSKSTVDSEECGKNIEWDSARPRKKKRRERERKMAMTFPSVPLAYFLSEDSES